MTARSWWEGPGAAGAHISQPRGQGDGAGRAAADPGSPLPLAASQNSALSYFDQMEKGMEAVAGDPSSGQTKKKGRFFLFFFLMCI